MKRIVPITALIFLACSGLAQANDVTTCVRPVSAAATFGEKVGRLANGTLGYMDAEEYSRSLPLMRQALNWPDTNNYERGVLYQMMGQAHYQLGDQSAAIAAFISALGSCGLTRDETQKLTPVVAQLYINNADYVKGAELLEDRHASGAPLQDNHKELLMQAWIQAEQYDKALPWAEVWFEETEVKQRKHYDLMNFLYNNLGMTDAQRGILQDMQRLWPDDLAAKKALESIGD